MPALDGTGPMGRGPMTGGGRGRCNPYYAGFRPRLGGYPTLQPYGWNLSTGLGMWPRNPYDSAFGALPRCFFRRGRGLRRWWR